MNAACARFIAKALVGIGLCALGGCPSNAPSEDGRSTLGLPSDLPVVQPTQNLSPDDGRSTPGLPPEPSPREAKVTVQKIVLSDEMLPTNVSATGGQYSLGRAEIVGLNRDGQVLFKSRGTVGTSNRRPLYFYAGGATSCIWPDLGSWNVFGFKANGNLVMNYSGDWAFAGSVAKLSTLAPRAQAAGLGGLADFGFIDIQRATLTNAGNVYVAARPPWRKADQPFRQTQITRSGVYGTDVNGAPLRPLALLGDQAPGFPAGIVFRELLPPYWGRDDFVANASDGLLFTARVSGPGVTEDNDCGLWVVSGGVVQLLVAEGQPAPDITDGGRFVAPIRYQINDAGLCAVEMTLTGDRASAQPASMGVWVGTPGNLSLVIDSNDALPGYPRPYPSTTYPNQTSDWTLTETGELFWRGFEVDTVYLGNTAGMTGRKIVNVPASGINGSIYKVPFYWTDERGHVVEVAYFNEPDGTVNGYSGRGLWAGRNGQVRLIAREGGLFEAAPGNFRTVAHISEKPTVEPNSGYAVFELTFAAELGVRDETSGLYLLKIDGP